MTTTTNSKSDSCDGDKKNFDEPKAAALSMQTAFRTRCITPALDKYIHRNNPMAATQAASENKRCRLDIFIH